MQTYAYENLPTPYFTLSVGFQETILFDVYVMYGFIMAAILSDTGNDLAPQNSCLDIGRHVCYRRTVNLVLAPHLAPRGTPLSVLSVRPWLIEGWETGQNIIVISFCIWSYEGNTNSFDPDCHKHHYITIRHGIQTTQLPLFVHVWQLIF